MYIHERGKKYGGKHMKKTAIFWILILTAITSLLFSIGIAFSYSQDSNIHVLGDYLLLSRLWQLAGIPILIYFLIRKMSVRHLIIPLILIILLAWPFVESALNWPLGADTRNLSWIIINVALVIYLAILLAKETENDGGPSPTTLTS